MPLVRILASALLPLLFWLLTGAPSPARPGVLVVLAIAVLFLWNMLWQPAVCRLLGADRYTYAPVFSAVTCVLTMIALGFAWRILVGQHVLGVGSWLTVGPFSLGMLLLAFMMTWLLPLLTRRRQAPLPDRSERRELQAPR